MNKNEQKKYKQKEILGENTLPKREIKNDLSKLIKNRLHGSGMSYAVVAQQIGTSAPQFGRFLMGEGSLTIDSLNKCLDLLRIDLTPIMKRNELAQQIAEKLKKKKYSTENVDEFSKKDIIYLTEVEELRYFPEIEDFIENDNKEDLEKYFKYIDAESTFDYMKELITYYMEIDTSRKTTFRQAKRSIKNNRDRTSNGEDSIFETILEAPPIVALSAIGVGLLGAITGLLFDDGDSEDED